MEWISVIENLPNLPLNKLSQDYLIVVQKKGWRTVWATSTS